MATSHLTLRPLGSDAARATGPTPAACRALGVAVDRLRRLPGGQGLTWTDGRVVVKPVGFTPERDWVCDVYANWPNGAGVRVPEPVQPAHTQDEPDAPRWSVDGWAAHVFVPGRDTELPTEIGLVREAGRQFHAALADLGRPSFLDERQDPWSYGDRMAWEDAEPIGDAATLELVSRLRSAFAPVRSPDQVIHGDLLPNVLVADGHPHAVIDWPPYFRPAALADAIVVTDAVTFRGAPLSLLERWADEPDWQQLLIRALVYRLGPTGIFASHDRLRGSLVRHVELVRPVVDAVLAG